MTEDFDDFFFDNEPSKDIDSVCLNCGYEALVPDFIYDEFGRLVYHSNLGKTVYTINCNMCNKVKVVPKIHLKQDK